MSQGNVQLVKRLFRAVQARDVEPMWEIYDPEIEINEATSLPYGGQFHGHAGVLEHGLAYVDAWDDLQTAEDRRLEAEFIDGGDRVLVLWRQKAHGADGRTLSMPVISEYEIKGGRVVRSRMHAFDSAEVAQFLAEEIFP